MRTNRVVRKSIKSLRSKRRNKVNRKTKKRTQKRTQKRVKRCKNNRKTKKIKRSYELTGGFGPHMLAAQRRRQQREQEEEERIRQEKIKLKEEAMRRREKYKEQEEKAKELFEEYRRIIHIMEPGQLVEILNGLKYEPYLIDQVRDIIKSSDREKLIEMVFSNTSRLRQVNKELWKKYFGHSEIIQNYYRGSPVMETSSPTTFQNPLAE